MRPIGFIPMGRFCLDQKHYPLPYPVIIAATKGEPQAMNIVVQHYAGYIAHLSMRKLRDERGNTYYGLYFWKSAICVRMEISSYR